MRLLSIVVLVAVAASACRRDPGRDVRPASLSLSPAGNETSDEIIPLDKVSKSQAAAVLQRVANTEITVTYSRPAARGRELFGKLVPYGEVWNPGADQATAVRFTRDVQIDDHPLKAGKYSIWAVPRAEMWTMIFSRASDVFHIPYPGEAQDALRFDVKPEQGPHAEVLTYEFPLVEAKDAVLRLHWGTTMVSMSIRVQ
jgi:hypothetical protein